jgi:hypothetical protein
MAENWGPGVSRTLSALARQFTSVVWQASKPPLDSELNLMGQIDWENLSSTVRASVHSGFFLDPTRADEDYEFRPEWVNQFILGPSRGTGGARETAAPLLACVNGWVFPVEGTQYPEPGGAEGTDNRITLYPPPTTDGRTDFVFLEVWRALVAPNPATANKPSAGFLWRNGNVESRGTQIADDLSDPTYGIETTKRIQLQYRIRVVGSGDALGTSVDLANYPDGLTDPQVRAQGAATSPGAFTFASMRRELGDPGLWRADDDDAANALGTIDGYVYAIPICAVFRRNTAPWTAVAASGNPNQNGAAERTPTSHTLASPRSGARTLTTATLAAALSPTATGYVTLTGYTSSALGDAALFPLGTTRRYLEIGTGPAREIVAINVNGDLVGHPNAINIDPLGRGRGGTAARGHAAGTPLRLYNTRPDGLYADQIAAVDVLDLRRGVMWGDWDYARLLQNALAALTAGKLRTTFKRSGTGGGTVGPVAVEVSYLQAPDALPAPAPAHVQPVDGPDGIRTVWSDAATVQRDITVIVDPDAPLVNGFTASTWDVSAGTGWSVGADFQPTGFLNALGTNDGWTNGSVVFFHLGGTDGTDGARAGLVGGQAAARFLSPLECWATGGGNSTLAYGSKTPWRLRFVGGPSGNTAGVSAPFSTAQNGYRAGLLTGSNPVGGSSDDHPGPMYPTAATNFERPFIVLGGVLHSSLRRTGVPATSVNFLNPVLWGVVGYQIKIPGLDFDAFGTLLGRDSRSLRDYLTDNGRDFTGNSSRLYLVVYGDRSSRDNNGAFRVVGAGTSGNLTQNEASDSSALVVIPLSADFSAFNNSTGQTVTIEFRSTEINAEDDQGRANPPAGLAVVLTDLRGTAPWSGAGSSVRLQNDGASPARLVPVKSKAVFTMDVLWYPNRGATPRVPDALLRFASVGSAATHVRNAVSAVDATFATEAPALTGERAYPAAHIQLWNRLSSRGLAAPEAPDYGGFVIGSTEQDRESELFVDLGSKTAFFRPLTLKTLTLKGFDTGASPSLVGVLTHSGVAALPKDGAAIFTTGMTTGYELPPEYVPRFGRQDIPYHTRTSSVDPILPGINHLFGDSTNPTADVFYLIGGEDNPGPSGTNLVQPMLFATGDPSLDYGERGTVGGAPHSAYAARKCHYTDVISSDLGMGLRGVELPPYLGVARLYGVYERADFLAHLDPTSIGAFQSDRITPIASPPKNLLAEGADKQTLYIRKNGAVDVTGTSAAHTYVVPESALDLTRIPTYTAGDGFDDFEYVVEAAVFGFAEGFITDNHFILARRHAGNGNAITTGSTLELRAVSMIVPAAAPRGDALYAAYTRTVYQGDPYFTRGDTVIQTADYTARYGQLASANARLLATPIEQYNATTGAMSVRRPNPRPLQVVASLDFYTTLGTGKIGGKMWPGTIVDCGHLETAAGAQKRIPPSSGSLPWRVTPRAFTEGQNRNTNRASVSFELLDLNKVTVAPGLQISLVGFEGGAGWRRTRNFLGGRTGPEPPWRKPPPPVPPPSTLRRWRGRL